MRPAIFSPVSAALLTSALILTGCGVGTLAPSSPELVQQIKMAPVSGKLLGGLSPIKGASIILWQTTSSGYASSSNHVTGTTSLQLATTTSDTNGNFSFGASPSYTCASGQFVYITATGGDTGAGPNPNSVQMAALGSCSHFDSAVDDVKIRIDFGELSTVAAAYALGNFMYVDPNGVNGTQLVYISAPANNNATTGSCSGLGSAMTCTSAGLAHAFANAANLVDAVHYDSTMPTGAAYAVPPSNAAGTAPQALINTLGNILQACTNSTGGSHGDGSACGTLFANTSTTSTSDNSATSGTYPTDELQAILNLAKNPASRVSTLYNTAPANGAFQPSLAEPSGTYPHDFSLAIYYPATVVGSTTTNLGYPIYLALDANDDVFTLTADASTPTESGVAGFTANGSSIFAQTYNPNYCYPGQVAVDNVGNVWMTNYSASSNTVPCNGTQGSYAIAAFSTSNGAAGTAANNQLFTSSSTVAANTAPYGIAFDRLNDIWYSRTAGTCTQCLYELKYTTGSPGTYAYPSTFTNKPVAANAATVSIDANQNIWLTSQTSSSSGYTSTFLTFPNQNIGAGLTPLYSSTSDVPVTQTLPSYGGYGLGFDASGNAWMGVPTAIGFSKPTYGTGTTTTSSKYYISSNVATVYYGGAAPAVGQTVTLNNFTTGTYFNGISVVVTSVSTGSGYFRFNFTHANVANSTTPQADTTGTAVGQNQITSISALSTSSSPVSEFTTSATSPGQMTFDGLGTLWYPSNSGSGSFFYFLPSGVSADVNPCYLPSAAVVCSSSSSYAQSAQIDSTGSAWLASGGGGNLVQIIGIAAPTWPQLSYGVPATRPQ